MGQLCSNCPPSKESDSEPTSLAVREVKVLHDDSEATFKVMYAVSDLESDDVDIDGWSSNDVDEALEPRLDAKY